MVLVLWRQRVISLYCFLSLSVLKKQKGEPRPLCWYLDLTSQGTQETAFTHTQPAYHRWPVWVRGNEKKDFLSFCLFFWLCLTVLIQPLSEYACPVLRLCLNEYDVALSGRLLMNEQTQLSTQVSASQRRPLLLQYRGRPLGQTHKLAVRLQKMDQCSSTATFFSHCGEIKNVCFFNFMVSVCSKVKGHKSFPFSQLARIVTAIITYFPPLCPNT